MHRRGVRNGMPISDVQRRGGLHGCRQLQAGDGAEGGAAPWLRRMRGQRTARAAADGHVQREATNIYGPMEAGFTSSQPGASCLGTNVLPGGVDTNLAEAVMKQFCVAGGLGTFGTVLDYCGGHANPFHYHERMTCLYSANATTGASTRIGTALDGNGVYGHHIAPGCEPIDLDACGGRTGVTPDSNGQRVYHYVVQNKPPFTIGCFGRKDHVATVAECRALYPSTCATAANAGTLSDDDGLLVTQLTTEHGTGKFNRDCPCFDAQGSNIASDDTANYEGTPGFLSSEGFERYPEDASHPEIAALYASMNKCSASSGTTSTYSPTAAPTASPTKSPTEAQATGVGSGTTNSPTAAPTGSPSRSPTKATATGGGVGESVVESSAAGVVVYRRLGPWVCTAAAAMFVLKCLC